MEGMFIIKDVIGTSITTVCLCGSRGVAAVGRLIDQMPDENVQVVCRVRPRNPRELRTSQTLGEPVVQVDSNTSSIRVRAKGEDKIFRYDFSAGEEVTQEELFEIAGAPITSRCLEGYNGTILCYGQTGSGKTFTIFGDSLPERSQCRKPTSRGLVPRILEYLWTNIPPDCEFRPKCAFYEIYQEKIYDLLDPANSSPLAVREDSKSGVYVEGCTEQAISSIDEAYELLSLGYRSRHVGETAMNRMSSRSHAIFQLTLEKKHVYHQNEVEVNHVISSRFSLVDLAGSERQRDTQTTGTRLREAAVINKSLTCLGKVITELISQPIGKNKKRNHINYRDSKLTFLLRDSLGGNSKTVLIATISPAETCYQETLSTLYFAQRSMNIRNTTRVNECVTGSMAALQAEVLSLRGQIEALSRPTVIKLSPSRSPKQPLTPIEFDKENKICGSSSDTHLGLLRINRELEDILEEKEALIIEKDREISNLKETVEKYHYELETIREVNQGRFGHAKILMTTLDELKRENENFIAEIDSLRHARNALLGQAEKDSTKIVVLNQELEKSVADNYALAELLKDSKIELQRCNEQVEDLQRRLNECHHHFLDEEARAEDQEISSDLRFRLKCLDDQISTDSLLIAPSRSTLGVVDNGWDAFVPMYSMGEDSSSEVLETASETEHDSDCDQSVSTVQAPHRVCGVPRSSSLSEEIHKNMPPPRALSDPYPTSERKPTLISQMFGYLTQPRKPNPDCWSDPQQEPLPPNHLTYRFIEFGSQQPSGNCTGRVLLSWQLEFHSDNRAVIFEIERAVLRGQTKSVYTPFCQIGTTDRRELVTSVCEECLHSVLRFRVRAVRFGVASKWSTPVTIRRPSQFCPTLQYELRCDQPYDNNGVFCWIGTLGGQRQYTNPLSSGEVKITTSCKWYPVDSSIYVEQKPTDLSFDESHPCSWIEVDLGEERLLVPTHYCLRGFQNCKAILRSWDLQGKKEEHSSWISIRRHHNDSTIVTFDPYPIGSWTIKDIFDSFRYFRILQLDQNSKGMPCSGIELYGTLIEKQQKQIKVPRHLTLNENGRLSSF